MKALLRPLFVGGLSIAIAATSLMATSSVAFAASRPSIVTWSLRGDVYEGDRPWVDATFTDGTDVGPYTVDVDWGDGSFDQWVLADLAARSFSVQKTVPYLDDATSLRLQVSLSDPIFTTSRFMTLNVLNRAPSITSFVLSATDLDAGGAVTAVGTFTDGAADTHTVKLDWGDGSPLTTMDLAAGVFTFTTEAHTYAANGDYTVSAIVADNAGAWAPATATVSVHASNQAPSVVSFGVTAGNEGGSSSLALTFSDPDVLDTHTVSVAWGDGSSSDPVVVPAGETVFGAEHVYADTGPYAVVLTLKDASHTVTAGASVSPTNVAPVVGTLSLSPSSVVDHQTVTLTGSFTDPGTADTFTLTVDWGDLTSSTHSLGTGRSFSDTHAYDAAGPVTIKATVADRDGGKSSSSVNLVVLPSNHAPADLLVGATTLLEGGSTTLSVSFTDAEPLDTHTVAIAWGDGSTDNVSLASGLTSTSLPHTYVETGTYTVAVTVTDGGGMFVTGGTSVTATNVLPSLASLVLTPSSVTDHQTLTVSGTFSDPGTADFFTVSWAWGDGSTSSQALAAGTRSFSASHEYAAANTYALIVTVTDRDNGTGTQSGSVVVTARNTAPSGLSLSSNVTGLSASVSGSFADPDPLDTHDVTMQWGDSTSSTWTIAAGATLFSETHTYLAAGTFTVTATVTDPAGAFTTATKSVVTTVPAVGPSALLDQMSALVNSFGLDWTTERWLLRKIDSLRSSLASGGNSQLCADLKTLGHISTYASRVLTNDQAAALDGLGRQLETAAGCSGTVFQSPKVQRASTVTPTVTPAPTPKKDTTTKATTTKTEKSEKPDVTEDSAKTEKSRNENRSRREGRDSR